jgi:cysteine desulfurase
MGFDPFRARGALRITLGRQNTAAEVAALLEALPAIVARLRPISQRSARVQGVTA